MSAATLRTCLVGALLWLGFALGAWANEPADDAAAAAETTEQPPLEIVGALHETLLGVMKEAEALGYTGRYDRLAPVVQQRFDLGFMAQKSVGRHWKTATPEDRQRLLEAFSRYTVANYAGRFTGWSGQEFETLGEEASVRGTILVRTVLHDPGEDDVHLDYRLRHNDAGWRIVDIYFNGTVSELALRRSEYSSLIKREGFDALLVKLDERVEEYATKPVEES